MEPLDKAALDRIFFEGRTHRAWLDKPVSDDLLKQLHALYIMGPTANNCLPARVLYVKSPEAKERLKPCLGDGNVEKTMAAPATAIIGFDCAFYTRLDELSGRTGSVERFKGNPAAEVMAFRNGSLQGGYFMLAARAVGLDVGPMSGFDNAAVDAEFFAGTEIKSNFLCNLGYGDAADLSPRGPRLSFDEVSEIL